MTPRSVRYAVGAALALLLSAPAGASPITVTFSGPVSSLDSSFHPTLSPGDTISGSVTYEGDVSGSGTVSGPPYGASFSFGPTSHDSSTVRWDVVEFGCFTGAACVVLSISTPLGGGLDHGTWLYFDFNILPTPPEFPETEYPLPAPSALATASNIYVFDLNTSGGSTTAVRLIAEITSVSFVPEPGGLTLLAAALVALSALRRRAA